MKTLSLLVILLTAASTNAQTLPQKETENLLYIMDIIEPIKKAYWPEWSDTHIATLLLSDETSFLINHPNADLLSDKAINDARFDTPIHYRDRQFPLNMAATFPLVDATPVIVMGDLENAHFSEDRWTWTLVHEHFHQFQMSAPGYFEATRQIDLAKDSTDQMWPLTYAFPYDDEKVNSAFNDLSHLLLKYFEGDEKPDAKTYLSAKKKLSEIISEKDYSYLNFQIWQEGLPRYLELILLDEAASLIVDFPFSGLKDDYRSEIRMFLQNPDLSKHKRISFYALGAAEWLLIDQINPNWKETYLERFFETDYLLEQD